MADLSVDLAQFRGPLDLLLHLVQEEEVDVYEISVSHIADRFLETVRSQVDSLDVDEAGEYLVMASQLLVLKSRALLPRDTPVDLEEVDPRLDLVRQLLEYRDFKKIAGDLGTRADAEQERVAVRVHGPDPRPLEEEELEVDLFSLVSAFQRLIRETGDTDAVAMPRERLPITHFVETLFDRLTEAGGRVSFEELLIDRRDRTQVIGAFLALLELIKLRKVLVLQDGWGEIQVEMRTEGMEIEDAVDQDLATKTIDAPDLGEDKLTRIVFMGSPTFAVPALRSLVGAGLAPVLVVTPPPRPAGRGRRKRDVPLAEEAGKLQLPVHRTADVNGRVSREAVAAASPEVIVTAGFGQKLGDLILEMPTKQCLNLHGSLLPKYRGASPVAAAVRDGVTATGVTLFVMDAKMDHGPIVAAQSIPLSGEETADDVMAALADVAADLIVRALPSYLADEIEPQEQDHEQATRAPKLTKEQGKIPWDLAAPVVHNHVRSVTSWPGAQTAWQPKVRHEPLPIVVLKTRAIGVPVAAPIEEGRVSGNGDPSATTIKPGTVVGVSPEGIDVACGEGTLRILRLKPSGKRALDVSAFLNSRRVVVGDRFL